MNISRRHLMKLAAASFIFFRIPFVFAKADIQHLRSQVFPVFLDTLLPADETPAATELGVDKILLEKYQKQTDYLKLIDYGCVWLERQARKLYQQPFSKLSATQCQAVVERLVTQPRNGHPYRFYSEIRREAVSVYYADARSWPGTGLNHTPQPQGYTDYHQAPKI